MMEKIKKVLLGGCAYTVIILTVFYLFALIADFTEKNISLGKFFIILMFGFIISVSLLVFELKINAIWKYLINYTVLLTAFCVVFVTAARGTTNTVAKVFISVVVFSMIYALILVLRVAFMRIYRTKSKVKVPVSSSYTPRYKNSDGKGER